MKRAPREIHLMTPKPGEAFCGREVPGVFTNPRREFVTCKDCLRHIAECDEALDLSA